MWIPRSKMGCRTRRKVSLSYADGLGYEVAQRMEIKFLTGDEAFKGLENVEFVK